MKKFIITPKLTSVDKLSKLIIKISKIEITDSIKIPSFLPQTIILKS